MLPVAKPLAKTKSEMKREVESLLSAEFINVKPQYNLEEVGRDGVIGVILLSTDVNSEQDLRLMYPSTVRCFVTRTPSCNPITRENLINASEGITAAADVILPGTKLDAVLYGCTSGAIICGADRIAGLINEARPGVPVSNPACAALAAFEALRAKRVSLLTPYVEDVNREVARFFKRNGFKVLTVGGFGVADDADMTAITPADIEKAAVDTCHPDADLVFISCTAMRASEAVDGIEKKLGIPAVSSNTALVWQSLKNIGYRKPIEGFGVLLSENL